MHWHKTPKKEFNPKKRLGYVHVYTGEGKGKTSAALGTALRAAGHNMRTTVIQFIKGHKDYGEMQILDRLQPHVQVYQFGRPEPTDLAAPTDIDLYYAQRGMEFARDHIVQDRPDILVLDEINPAVRHGLIDLEELLDFIDNRHRHIELILTGRDAPSEVLNAADLITVMNATRHPYHDEFQPRRGIEH